MAGMRERGKEGGNWIKGRQKDVGERKEDADCEEKEELDNKHKF